MENFNYDDCRSSFKRACEMVAREIGMRADAVAFGYWRAMKEDAIPAFWEDIVARVIATEQALWLEEQYARKERVTMTIFCRGQKFEFGVTTFASASLIAQAFPSDSTIIYQCA